jgi:hypothetical protein
MPRNCGCSGASCACRIVSTDGSIAISGSGSAQNPWNLSAGDIQLGGRLQIQDTDTINMHQTGSGSVADPYMLSADATLDLGDLQDVDDSNTTVGYVLARAVGGGFAMVPASTAPVGEINTGEGIDGDGSVGNPLIVADWANLARLEASPDSPNMQWLELGSTLDENVYGVRMYRKNQDAEDVTDSAMELRLYDWGDGLAAAMSLFEDGVEASRLRLDRNGSVVVTGTDGISARIPWRKVTGITTVTFNNSAEANTDVAFAAGFFTATPRVVGSINQTGTLGSARLLLPTFGSLGPDGMRIYVRQVSSSLITGSYSVAWEATQSAPA